MATYSQNVFVGQRLQVDGHIFRGNTFQNCVLVYGGGPLDFSNNNLHGVRWEFVDSAARTVALLSSFYQQGGESKEFVDILLTTFGRPLESPSASSNKKKEPVDG